MNVPYPIVCVALLVLIAPVSVFAADSDPDIQHLLGAIERSGCTFVRNGKEYSAAEARSHMERKYTYAKGKITKAEQFIDYIATKSSMTGKPYLIRCGGKAYRSKEWLLVELDRFRNN